MLADQESQMDTSGRPWLVGAGVLSASIAALHLGIIVAGPPAYTFFGAADLAPLAAAGSPVPALLTAGLALLFTVWTWYAWAGAGLVRRPPLLRLGLWVIGAIYTGRGLALFPELLALWRGNAPPPPRFVVFSLVALATGLAYLVGGWHARASLRGARRDSSAEHRA
jgi:hypothetical protein